MFDRRRGEDFSRFVGRVYCGRACSDPGRGEALSARAVERFLSFCVPEPNSGCWLWLGGLTRGYGVFADKGMHRAPRYSFEKFKGPIPDGIIVRHTCDNKLCVNPDHLVLGTVKDNAQDALQRGLIAVGERNHNSKLTDEQALSIIADPRPQNVLAKEYGVARSTICVTKSGKRRRHLWDKNPNGECEDFIARRMPKKDAA